MESVFSKLATADSTTYEDALVYLYNRLKGML